MCMEPDEPDVPAPVVAPVAPATPSVVAPAPVQVQPAPVVVQPATFPQVQQPGKAYFCYVLHFLVLL